MPLQWGKAKTAGTFQKALGHLINVCKYPNVGRSEKGTRHFSEQAGSETQEILFKHQEILIYYEGDQALEQLPQRDSGVTLPADFQNLSERCPGQTDVGGGLAWTWGLDEMTSRGVFKLNLSVVLILSTGLETNNPYKYTSIIQ